MPVFPCRCFGLMPSSAIFVSAASHNSVHSASVTFSPRSLFQDPVHPRPHPPFSRQPSVVFPSDRLGTAELRLLGSLDRYGAVSGEVWSGHRNYTAPRSEEPPRG